MSLTLINNFDDPIVTKVKSSLKSISVPISSAITTTLSLWDHDSIETKIYILERFITFIDYQNVYNFLKNNQFLIPLLFEAYGEVFTTFDKDTDLSLKVKAEDGTEKLYLLIRTSDLQAYDLLDELDENWWIDAIPRANHKMNIDLEY